MIAASLNAPDNNEMKRTKPTATRVARSSPLNSVFSGPLKSRRATRALA
jgi:hypothetical protein